MLDGRVYEVVGVAPREVHIPEGTEVWVLRVLPTATYGGLFDYADVADLPMFRGLIGRRVSWASRERVEAEIQTLNARQARVAYERSRVLTGGRAEVRQLEDVIVGDVRNALWLLGAAVGFVVLVGGVNVASLSVALTVARGSELAVRTAVGAPTSALVRAALGPVVLLICSGAVAGVLLAWWGIEFLDQVIVWGSRTRELVLNPVVVAGAVLTAGLMGATAAVAALMMMRRRPLYRVLATEHRALSRRLVPFTTALLTLQVALSVGLSAYASATLNGLRTLVATPTGVDDPSGLTVADVIAPRDSGDSAHEDVQALLASIGEAVRALPGVQYVGFVDNLPFAAGDGGGLYVSAAGREGMARTRTMGGEAFQALGIPILAGRGFAAGDRGAVVISASFARALWGRPEDAVGQRVEFGDRSVNGPRRVVGVAADVTHAQRTSTGKGGICTFRRLIP